MNVRKTEGRGSAFILTVVPSKEINVRINVNFVCVRERERRVGG